MYKSVRKNLPEVHSSSFTPFQPGVAFHIENSHLFCSSKQMTYFYMKRDTGLKGVNKLG